MTALDYKPIDLPELRRSLRLRLDEFARRVRARLMLEAVARWTATVAGAALFSFLLDWSLRLSHFTRRGLLFALIAIAVVEAWRLILLPLRLHLVPDVLAAALERKTGQSISARVATVLEERDDQSVSSPMIERAVTRSYESLNAIDFDDHFDPKRRQRAIALLIATAVVWLATFAIVPSATMLWAARFFGGSDRAWPQRTYLQVAGVSDGVMNVPRGEAFALRVSAKPGAAVPETIAIRWRQGRSSRISGSLTKFAANDFRYDFPALDADAQVELSGGDDAYGPFTIRVVDRPKIVDLTLLTKHPTGPEMTHRFSGVEASDLAFLPLTQMELRFTANTPIAEARVASATTKPSTEDLHRVNEREFAINWTHESAARLQIELTGADAGLTSIPTSVTIGLKTDTPPRSTLGFRGVRQRVTPQATIPLIAEARDDYGVRAIDLKLKTESIDPADPKRTITNGTTRPIYPSTQHATQSAAPEQDVRQPHTLELPALQLLPGNLVSVTATASDACYTGAQSRDSRQITFRIVRPEELFREILLRQQSERVKFRKQTDEAKKLRDAMTPNAAPQQLARQHRAMQREVNHIATAFNDSLTEMKLNVLGTPEAYALMEKTVLQPLRTLDQELLSPQTAALDSLRPADSTALGDVTDRQDQIVDRMNAILKQMSQWDSFIDVLNQLNEIIRVQTQVEKGTNRLKQKQTDDVFDK